MLYLAGLSISLFLGLLMIGKRNKTRADKILTAWLFILSLHLALYYISFSDIIRSYPFLFGLHFPLPLLHGPFLYLYARALTRNPPESKRTDLLHFIPALIFYIVYIPFFLMPLEKKIAIINNHGAGFQPAFSISIVSVIISGIVYVIVTSLLLEKHHRSILGQFSNTEKINLRWLQYLTIGIGLIWVFIIFSQDEIIFGVAVLFILFIGFFGIKQVGIFTQEPSSTVLPAQASIVKETTGTQDNLQGAVNETGNISEEREPGSRSRKYSKSGLTVEAAEKLHGKLTALMNTEKLYRESDLTLSQLAGRLNTHPNYLSQVINEKENKTFFDYINTLRTREFIDLVSKEGNQKYTLLGLAFECGFNSKSSFNKYFRKIMGTSPSDYVDGLKTGKP